MNSPTHTAGTRQTGEALNPTGRGCKAGGDEGEEEEEGKAKESLRSEGIKMSGERVGERW